MKEGTSTEIVMVRRPNERDAAAIASLSGQLGYPADAGTILARIRAVTASIHDLLVVATNPADETLGWLQAHSAHLVESGFRVEIVGLIVSPAARRSGIGRALVAAAERWAASLKAQIIVARSNTRRVESHAFYPALGFSEIKTQRVYRKPLPDA